MTLSLNMEVIIIEKKKEFSILSQNQTHQLIKVNLWKLLNLWKLMVSFSNQPKWKRESYFVTNKKSNWWIIKSQTKVNTGVPQWSILGPILANIFLCNLVFLIKNRDVTIYIDDTTPCETRKRREIPYMLYIT